MLGIGGGGDVVGALAVARHCEALGLEFVLGGIAWERLPIDRHAGPRCAAEISGARPLADHVLLAGPDARTPTGALFAEAGMAALLGRETVLVDILAGPSALASGLADAMKVLGADAMVSVDVGGDVLGDGSEPGLASPLCDAVMLAATAQLARAGTPALGAVFGPGCDGELTIEELLDQLAALAADGGLLGAAGMAPATVDELEQMAREIPTEASAQAVRCARGEVGEATIRQGRRHLLLSPFGALTFYFDPVAAADGIAALARAVTGASSLEQANDALHARGVRTELDYERASMEI